MSVQQMVQHLVEMIELHRELLELGNRKRKVLVDGLVDELAEITSAESRIVSRITAAERELFQCARRFLSEKGYTPDLPPNLGDVIKLVFDPQERAALQTAQRQLLDLIDELKRVNELNRVLIEQSLAFINYTIEMMTDTLEDDMMYRRPDQQDWRNSSRGLFDTRA